MYIACLVGVNLATVILEHTVEEIVKSLTAPLGERKERNFIFFSVWL